MTSKVLEKRHSERMAACHPVVLYDMDGHVLVKGKSSNISEKGVLIVAQLNGDLPKCDEVIAELTVPNPKKRSDHQNDTRKVRFRGKIVRSVCMGSLIGLGVEFLENIS